MNVNFISDTIKLEEYPMLTPIIDAMGINKFIKAYNNLKEEHPFLFLKTCYDVESKFAYNGHFVFGETSDHQQLWVANFSIIDEIFTIHTINLMPVLLHIWKQNLNISKNIHEFVYKPFIPQRFPENLF